MRRTIIRLLVAGMLCAGFFGLVGCSAQNTGSAAGGLSLAANASSAPASTSSTAIAVGKEAPDFTFTTVTGSTAKLSDYRGQTVFLNFWATWCGYCAKEMPSMEQIAQNHPEVAVIAINRGEATVTATQFATAKGYGFIWALDPDGTIAALYPSSGLPYSLFIDGNGVVRTIYKGSPADTYAAFEKGIASAPGAPS